MNLFTASQACSVIKMLRDNLGFTCAEFASILGITELELNLIEDQLLVPEERTMNTALDIFERSQNATHSFLRCVT